MGEEKKLTLTSEVLEELKGYIQEHYEIAPQYSDIGDVYMSIPDGLDFEQEIHKDTVFFEQKEARSLEDVIEEIGESFHDQLFRYIDMSGMTDVEVYKRANIDRKLFSKIRSNPAYHPRKNTILALAIALQLSLDEMTDLLCRAEYALSPSSKTDLIVKFFIEKGIYDIFVINEALHQYGEPILG